MNNAFWRDALIGIYKQMRTQQEMLNHVALEVEALSTVLQASSQFRDLYEQTYEALKHGPTAQRLSSTLKAIDFAIDGLMKGGTGRAEGN
jgi:hypothetical protein